MSEEQSQTNKPIVGKYAIYAIMSTGLAYVIYKTYQRRREDASKRASKSYSITESLETSWEDLKRVKQQIPNMNIVIQQGKSMDLFPTKQSMKFYSPQPKFQKHGSASIGGRSLSPQISLNSTLGFHHADYGKELTPIVQHRPFTRQSTIPKLDLSATFLGESSYRETVIFLLALAVNRLFPNEQLIICNTFKFGTSRRSYFCRFQSGFDFDNESINQIENEMLRLSRMELELQSKFIDYDTCLAMLQTTNQHLSAKLVQSLNRPCYRMVGAEIDDDTPYYILQYRSTLNNTKYASRFKLHASNDIKCHFVVKFPHDQDPMDDDAKSESFRVESSQRSQPKAIRELYEMGLEMSKYLDIRCVADINGIIREGRFKELILVSEAYHNRQIIKISNKIKAKSKQKQNIKMILISGPSSSGKTTFASKLGIQLRLLGFAPTVMEVDMFYRDRKDPNHPRDEKGNLNFEVIEAVKIKEFNETINRLLSGDAVKIPIFDFKTGSRTGYKKEKLKLDQKNGILVMEGIFCLNPKLLLDVKDIDDITFKIFICPITPFYALDNFHFISEQVMRLIRRISRDHFHRGKDCDQVVFKWGQLTEGEDINIFPYVRYADAVFNSALLYELCVLKVYSYPLLQTVELNSKQYKDAQNLLSFLQCYFTMPDNSVPNDSLLMEFIGKSIFEEL